MILLEVPIPSSHHSPMLRIIKHPSFFMSKILDALLLWNLVMKMSLLFKLALPFQPIRIQLKQAFPRQLTLTLMKEKQQEETGWTRFLIQCKIKEQIFVGIWKCTLSTNIKTVSQKILQNVLKSFFKCVPHAFFCHDNEHKNYSTEKTKLNDFLFQPKCWLFFRVVVIFLG